MRYNFFVSNAKHIADENFFSCKAAAERLGKTPAYISKLCRDGKLDAKKVDGAWLVRLPENTASSHTQEVEAPKQVVQTKKQSNVQETALASPTIKTLSDKIVSRMAIIVPTKEISTLPVAYVKSLPMIVGVVMVLALFFLGTLPFMSQPLAQQVELDKPFIAMGNTLNAGQDRFLRKTDELLDYTSLSASVGVSSLGKEIGDFKVSTKVHANDATARPSSLARTIANSDRKKIDLIVGEQTQLLASAAMSLYQFEQLRPEHMFKGVNTTWGCIFGVSSCDTATPVVPLRGITVYDIETKQVHCLQVINGDPRSTPGRCDIEDRE